MIPKTLGMIDSWQQWDRYKNPPKAFYLQGIGINGKVLGAMDHLGVARVDIQGG